MLTYKLFTQPNCYKCPALKAWLYNNIGNELITEIDCSTESGFQLAKLNNITSTPTVIVEENGVEVKRFYEVPKND